MQKIEDLTEYEYALLFARANSYKEKHEKLVKELVASTKDAYPPSGSDMLRPELWKPGHWLWFKGIWTPLLREPLSL